MIRVSISDGLSLGPARCALILQPSDDEDPESDYDSVLANWERSSGAAAVELGYVAKRVSEWNGQTFVLGRLGRVTRFQADERTEEEISGPDDLGFLTDLSAVGDSLYAAGMSRQVYRRRADGVWARYDDGVLDKSESVDEVSGFRSIDGVTEQDLYAVGLNGEIWNCRSDEWRRIESPTNLTLEQVRAVESDLVFAAGQHGVIVRGAGDSWEVLGAGAPGEIWGIEWFRDQLYVATPEAVLRLDTEDSLTPVPIPGDGETRYSRVRAGHGALWSFGSNRAFWSEDGDSWHEAQIRGE